MIKRQCSATTLSFLVATCLCLAFPTDDDERFITKNDDGFIALRDVQAFGTGIPLFKAKVFNGMLHDWDSPLFQVTLTGHREADNSKRIIKSFTVDGMCVWAKGQECSLAKSLDFGAFVVEKFSVQVVGGTRIATQVEKVAAAEKKRIADAEKAKKAAAERDEAIAGRAKLRTACALIYRKTVNKKIGDLTVKESQQIQACQALGLYEP